MTVGRFPFEIRVDLVGLVCVCVCVCVRARARTYTFFSLLSILGVAIAKKQVWD